MMMCEKIFTYFAVLVAWQHVAFDQEGLYVLCFPLRL
jgi:hypothetical protein